MQLTSQIVVVFLVVAKMLSVSNSLMRSVIPTTRNLAFRTMHSARRNVHSISLMPGARGQENGDHSSRFSRLSLITKLVCGETRSVINS